MVKFLYVDSLLPLALATLPWSVPVALYVDDPVAKWVAGAAHVVALLVAVWLAIWVPLYYGSIRYGVDVEWLYAEGGVIWRRRSRLPVRRVQMVNTIQGPWQRRYGIATVGIYTAATGQPTAEMAFLNVADADSLRERVLLAAGRLSTDGSGVDEIDARRRTPGDAGERAGSARTTPSEPDQTLGAILEELRSIRRSLGQRRNDA